MLSVCFVCLFFVCLTVSTTVQKLTKSILMNHGGKVYHRLMKKTDQFHSTVTTIQHNIIKFICRLLRKCPIYQKLQNPVWFRLVHNANPLTQIFPCLDWSYKSVFWSSNSGSHLQRKAWTVYFLLHINLLEFSSLSDLRSTLRRRGTETISLLADYSTLF